MKKKISIIFKIILFTFLTITTQIGGIIYLLSLIIVRKWDGKNQLSTLFVFTGLYLLFTLFIIPMIAPIFGREKVRHSKKVQASSPITVLLNRNYVRPKINELLYQVEKELSGSAIKIQYLDANFAFIDRFPLFPHLSHNDGKKIDLSFVYETSEGKITHRVKSISGYGVFESPTSKEYSQTKKCLEDGYLQYDYSKYLTFGEMNKMLVFSAKGTEKLIQGILKSQHVGKIFIEPHLKKRMNLTDDRVRNHGCGSVRHDDHIHVQLK